MSFQARAAAVIGVLSTACYYTASLFTHKRLSSDRDRHASPGVDPTIITRDQHVISRAQISDKALSVLYRLKNAGYGAYLVGGGVRDLSLGREPKDFDVATDATPDEVKALFRNCRLIGRRFRLAHVHWGPEIIEVATFRAMTPDADSGDKDHVVEDGLVLRDNVYGTIEEDALRRDFTINAFTTISLTFRWWTTPAVWPICRPAACD